MLIFSNGLYNPLEALFLSNNNELGCLASRYLSRGQEQQSNKLSQGFSININR